MVHGIQSCQPEFTTHSHFCLTAETSQSIWELVDFHVTLDWDKSTVLLTIQLPSCLDKNELEKSVGDG